MEDKKAQNTKTPIFVVAPKDRKIAVGELSQPQNENHVKVITVKLKKPVKMKKILKSTDTDNYYEFEMINLITLLIERDFIEDALRLINLYFSRFSILEKKTLSPNIIEATTQYNITPDMLPEEYYDFLVSDESNDLFL